MAEELIDIHLEDNINISSYSYVSEIDKIVKSNQSPETKLDLLDLLVRDFFRKKFHFKRNMEYEEMINFFLEKNKPYLAAFCHEMIIALYSGDMTNEKNITIMLDDIKKLIEKENSSEKSAVQIAKNILSPLVDKFRKPKIAKTSAMKDTKNLSKQTKKIIDSFIENKESISEQVNRVSLLDQKQREKSLSYELNPALIPGEDSEEPEEYKAIRSIDDLERIKQKIKTRKTIIKNVEDIENSYN